MSIASLVAVEKEVSIRVKRLTRWFSLKVFICGLEMEQRDSPHACLTVSARS